MPVDGARLIEIFGAFSHLRDHRDLGRQHFHEPYRHREVVLRGALAVPHLARAERREERRMARQHAEVALRPRKRHLVHLVGERLIGCDDVERDRRRQGHGYCFILAALSSTSSMVPLR